MVVSSNYNLIPYPDHHYPIQPYISDNAMARQHHGQESVERHDRFQRPPAEFKAGDILFDIPDSGYDISRCLHYCDEYQVGRLIDIYA